MLGGVCPRICYYETRTTKLLGAENEISVAGLCVLYHGRERERDIHVLASRAMKMTYLERARNGIGC